MQTIDQEWGSDPNDSQALAYQQQLEEEQSTAIATVQPATVQPMGPLPLSTFDEMWRMATVLANATGMIPTHFINKPESVFVVLEWSRTTGLPAFTALQHISVIEGKPYIGFELVKLLVLRHPDCEDMYVDVIGSGDEMMAVATIKRKNRRITIERFSVADAKVAKLWGKLTLKGLPTPWVLHPTKMMEKIVLVRAARKAFPDALFGMYPVDEREMAIVSELPDQNVERLPDYKRRLAAIRMVGMLPDQQRLACEGWLAKRGGMFQLATKDLDAIERRCKEFNDQKRKEAREAHSVMMARIHNDEATMAQIDEVEKAAAFEDNDVVDMGKTGNVLQDFTDRIVTHWPEFIKPTLIEISADEKARDSGVTRFGPIEIDALREKWHVVREMRYEDLVEAFDSGGRQGVEKAVLAKEIDLGRLRKTEQLARTETANGIAATSELAKPAEGKPIKTAHQTVKKVAKKKDKPTSPDVTREKVMAKLSNYTARDQLTFLRDAGINELSQADDEQLAELAEVLFRNEKKLVPVNYPDDPRGIELSAPWAIGTA